MNEKNLCGQLLKQIHDGLEKQANNDLRAHDLTMAQVSVLMLLNRADGGTAAQRIGTIRHADRILVMKDGDTLESGTHEELLKKGGFDAELYNSRFEQAS